MSTGQQENAPMLRYPLLITLWTLLDSTCSPIPALLYYSHLVCSVSVECRCVSPISTVDSTCLVEAAQIERCTTSHMVSTQHTIDSRGI
ncbi:uncharacterized protein B0H18DRAFT_1094183 [Fomitopsis serialis]|uniref:uncharacterized protein n=1 Tax=Fomitopsis serialis TaxID=139415 RepID=UPI0020077FE5|nr:uncharacterized protein B0H18DRAFT_1094183 [Neoantrodia serialis]KAH9928740.1 hypothetical protein B0H18DRAFT_1094183 [Neoantrodia serialis]